jgi:hypothetical protein
MENYHKDYYQKNRDKLKKKALANYYANKSNPEYIRKRRIRDNKESREIRKICLIHYSENPPKCSCCGETIFDFLTIDHIKGNGTLHREKVGRGTQFFYWLKRNNFPEGYKVLCYNCNCAKGHLGFCPHERR